MDDDDVVIVDDDGEGADELVVLRDGRAVGV